MKNPNSPWNELETPTLVAVSIYSKWLNEKYLNLNEIRWNNRYNYVINKNSNNYDSNNLKNIKIVIKSSMMI